MRSSTRPSPSTRRPSRSVTRPLRSATKLSRSATKPSSSKRRPSRSATRPLRSATGPSSSKRRPFGVWRSSSRRSDAGWMTNEERTRPGPMLTHLPRHEASSRRCSRWRSSGHQGWASSRTRSSGARSACHLDGFPLPAEAGSEAPFQSTNRAAEVPGVPLVVAEAATPRRKRAK